MVSNCFTKEFDNKNMIILFDENLNDKPIESRKYTVSFLSGDNRIKIANNYKVDFSKDNTFILGEIAKKDGLYKLLINVYFKNFDHITSSLIYKEAKTNIHKILKNIINSDKEFFQTHEMLLSIPIYVSFNSSYFTFNQIHLCGYLNDFLEVD